MSAPGATLAPLLDDLCYVFECLALDYTGEAKDALSQLCDRLEADAPPVDAGLAGVLATLRDIRARMPTDRMGATGDLAALSRRLWALSQRGAGA